MFRGGDDETKDTLVLDFSFQSTSVLLHVNSKSISMFISFELFFVKFLRIFWENKLEIIFILFYFICCFLELKSVDKWHQSKYEKTFDF